MPIAFREVFATYGVDEDRSPPGMIVPFHGFTLVALEAGKDLTAAADSNIVKVEKLGDGGLQKFMVLANHVSAQARGSRLLGDDTGFFQVIGQKTGGAKGTTIHAIDPKTGKKIGTGIQAVVLGKRTIKIAIQPVQVRDDKGKWVPVGTRSFDADDLRDQMNDVWTPQANIDFNLVSSDPLRIEEDELSKALKGAGIEKAEFVKEADFNAFESMFKGHKHPKADFTIFLVGSILSRNPKAPRERPTFPAGQTSPGGGFCLACDAMAHDLVRESRHLGTIPGIVLAHEAGHYMGVDNHPTDNTGVLLMVEGGPIVGYGKVPFERTIGLFNTHYT